jgi:hypothetical protein
VKRPLKECPACHRTPQTWLYIAHSRKNGARAKEALESSTLNAARSSPRQICTVPLATTATAHSVGGTARSRQAMGRAGAHCVARGIRRMTSTDSSVLGGIKESWE